MRFPGWWRNLKRRFAERLRERITGAGFVYIAVLLLLATASFLTANNLLFLLLAAMLAALLVSSLISRLGLAGLALDVSLPQHVSARSATTAHIVLTNEKRFLPSFSIHLSGIRGSVFSTPLYFPVVPGRGSAEATIDVYFERRGLYREDSFQFSSRFPFGFAERRFQVTMRRDVVVYPSLEPVPWALPLLAAVEGEADALFLGRGTDFYRIRPYQPPESARHVDWRATAHTGELQVREFAREQEPLLDLFLDLEAGPGEEEWFEEAIECAAFLSWRFAQRAARVRFRTAFADIRVPEEAEVYAILQYLALVERRRAAVPQPENGGQRIEVVLTARPDAFAAAGWDPARLVAPVSAASR
jgi:uncharacterized protein (DUF58 family)